MHQCRPTAAITAVLCFGPSELKYIKQCKSGVDSVVYHVELIYALRGCTFVQWCHVVVVVIVLVGDDNCI